MGRKVGTDPGEERRRGQGRIELCSRKAQVGFLLLHVLLLARSWRCIKKQYDVKLLQSDAHEAKP